MQIIDPSQAAAGSHIAERSRFAHAVDLAVEDLPHDDATLEWWYANGHIRDTEGREYSLFMAIFRTAVEELEDGTYRWGHALTWGLSSLDERRYIAECLVDQDSAEIGLDRLDRGIGPQDERLRKALREVMERGEVPRPDIQLSRPPVSASDRLHLDLDERVFESLGGDRYRLRLHHTELEAGCELIFQLEKPIVLHGDNGVVTGSTLDEMFYYFCPRCSVEGSIVVDGERREIASGSFWYDHEYGRGDDPDDKAWEARWNWISAQFDNGWEMTIYDVFDSDDGSPTDHVALLIDPEGRRHEYREFSFTGDRPWVSARTFQSYPTRWKIDIPEIELSLEATAPFPEQEFVTYITKAPFWEGRVDVRGTFAGRPVTGPGYVERAGFGGVDSLEDFFGAVGDATRRSVRGILPNEPSRDDLLRITADEEHRHYTDSIDPGRFRETVIEPIRGVVDRGGKAWRSYCLLACCDAVGGNSQEYLPWLALPELLHVGSLIVDDVQDDSENRRGGPACHLVHGVPLAINAGNLSYFLPYLAMSTVELTEGQRLEIYDEYFRAVRAGHVGQALDLAGLLPLMATTVDSGDASELKAQVLSTHRLKSAAPAAALARIGAILGGGSRAQMEALGTYHESLGLAFQIMDDVLNLRGFERDLKDRGEDITAGKVTVPIAMAMAELEASQRARVHRALEAHTSDPDELSWVLRTLEDTGVFDRAEAEARQLVEEGWAAVAPLLKPSVHSVHLRAFGSFVLDRHY
ncbi:MAG: polyprenyl synthetase family protein [Myxococcota bacterium]